MEIIVIGLIAFVGWYVWIRPRQDVSREMRNDSAQTWVERRVIEILHEDPNAPDEVIAQLVRDELVNYRIRDPEFFAWASAETVARIKRTAIRHMRKDKAHLGTGRE